MHRRGQTGCWQQMVHHTQPHTCTFHTHTSHRRQEHYTRYNYGKCSTSHQTLNEFSSSFEPLGESITFSTTEQEVQLPKENEKQGYMCIEQGQKTRRLFRLVAHHRGWEALVEGDGASAGAAARLTLIC